jgi:hypothetical protein
VIKCVGVGIEKLVMYLKTFFGFNGACYVHVGANKHRSEGENFEFIGKCVSFENSPTPSEL